MFRILIVFMIILLSTSVSFAAPKTKKQPKNANYATDLALLKGYFLGKDGQFEETTATGEKVVVDGIVASDKKMYDFISGLRKYASSDFFIFVVHDPDRNGNFQAKLNINIDSDKIENASDFNKLFDKVIPNVEYFFKCNKNAKICYFDDDNNMTNASYIAWPNDVLLVGKAGELENLYSKRIYTTSMLPNMMSMAASSSGKFDSLFYFMCDGCEFNAKTIALLKKYFPKTPVAYNGIIRLPSETGWEPKK